MGKLSAEHKQKILDARKFASENYLEFQLDSHTQLTSNKHCIMLETRSTLDSAWSPSYFYSTIHDAIRGYVKYAAKKKLRKSLSKDLAGLLNHLQDLERLVENTAKTIQEQIESASNDPILASFGEEK